MREKLIELLGNSFDKQYSKRGLLTAPHTADDLIANGVVISNSETTTKWIPVTERLPPYNHDVLVYRPNMASKILVDCYVGYYGEDDGEWYEDWARYGKDIHNKPLITHWAEMPQPPKGE